MKVGDIVWDKRHVPDYPKELAIVLRQSEWPHPNDSWDIFVNGDVDRRWEDEIEVISESR